MDREFKIDWQNLLIICVLLISAVAHGYNMFHFPYYENDEGTYISQAWSLLKYGRLAPYTYWYDHAPAGWFLIALWTKLTGGFFTFGVSVNSGRVLMLVLHIFTAYFLINIAKKLSGNIWSGIIAVLVFSLSPLAIYFQRRVLLDNIMIFWVFFSFWLLLHNRLKLRYVYLSAVAFGIGVLTKENAIFFTPVFVYMLYNNTYVYNRYFAIIKWLAVSFSIISFYLFYAVLKSEFFPPGFMQDTTSHVSLIYTWQTQLLRGNGVPFWNKNSDFFLNLYQWLHKDYFVIMAGLTSTIFNAIVGIKIKSFRITAFFAAAFWFFLVRGNLVIDFYIAPLIPLLALNIGMLVDFIARNANLGVEKILSFLFRRPYKISFVYYFILFVTIFTVPYILLKNPMGQYTRDETTPQVKALNWAFNNISKDANIAIDDFAYIDFKERGYRNADWFWKIWYDPEIENKFGNDWRNVRYLFMTHEMLKQAGLKTPNEGFGKNMFSYFTKIAMFKPLSSTYIDFGKRESTNGDWVAIFKRKDLEEINLLMSWNDYKKDYIKSYGQVVDPANGETTSEGQSYAMLRAVWENDKPAFDGVWRWTQDHFQYRLQDKLLSWQYYKKNGKYQVTDSASASDADEDTALSLLFAYKRWGDASYLNSAKQIINDIWNHEVVKVNDRYYLIAGTSANLSDGYLVNPSYFSPASYKIFARADPDHPWNRLADDSYLTLNKIGSSGSGNNVNLPPNWTLLDKNTGDLISASNHKGSAADYYGFDAFRVMWRVALDAAWFGDNRASYLAKIEPFYAKWWRKDGRFVSVYNTNGERASNYGNFSTDAGALIVFSQTDKNLADAVFQKIFMNKKNPWTAKKDYYSQNWAWFSSALYSGNTKNLTSITCFPGENCGQASRLTFP